MCVSLGMCKCTCKCQWVTSVDLFVSVCAFQMVVGLYVGWFSVSLGSVGSVCQYVSWCFSVCQFVCQGLRCVHADVYQCMGVSVSQHVGVTLPECQIVNGSVC